MQAKTIQYGRTVNLGNYENMRAQVTYELEEGETLEAGFKQAYEDVRAQVDGMKAWMAEAEAAEHKQYEPWKCTPEMVSDLPTLPERARRAAELTLEHEQMDFTDKARKRARELFGFDVPFERQLDNTAVATVDGITFTFKYDDFTVEVPGAEGEPARRTGYVRDLAKLGQFLAGLPSGDGIPF